jgi:protein Tex
VTATPILETLAREFKTDQEHVRNALEMIDAGLSAPFIGRFRHALVGNLNESTVRRLALRRQEFEELDRRRGTILRLLERDDSVPASAVERIRTCMDRFELEDLFLPHRRPEPEVQLAMDRGLGALADELTKAMPRDKSKGEAPAAKEAKDANAPDADAAEAPAEAAAPESAPAADAPAETPADSAAEAPAEAAAEAPAESVAEAPAAETATEAPQTAEAAPATGSATATATADAPAADAESLDSVADVLNADLARLCQPYVSPDKGIHDESEALAGAMRILSDKLGRDPRVRGQLRRMLAKNGVLSVRPLVEDGKAGRHRSLLKLKQPMRQLQGHRLLALRQAQKERVLTTRIHLDPKPAIEKVRAALGKHTRPEFEGVLDRVARRALERRLLPMLEEDIRLVLKERADTEALRFLSQHLRQLLLTPTLGRRMSVCGVDVNAKGDWSLVVVDENGEVISPEVKIEVGEKDAATLGAELVASLGEWSPGALALSNAKPARAAAGKLRAALAAGGVDVFPFIVTEAGLSSYANSEMARKELGELGVPARMAVSLARRLIDPMNELLKVDPRHLGLGAEQGLVSKANVRRTFVDAVESCTAHVGCDVNRAPAHFLAHLPGLDRDSANKLVARRAERPFTSRDELREEGLLTEAQWTSAVAFLRVYGSDEPLDRSNLHPEQYPLARKVLEAAGSSVQDGLGRPGNTKGMRGQDFETDPDTWRTLTRELSFPGRDPRHRHHVPELLPENTDPVMLTKDRILEGVITNVASFGVFIDVGLPQDAMVHISEVSDRYVRDARELLSVGQIVRGRIVEAGGRLTLSLKNIPREPRPARNARSGGGRGAGGREGGNRGGGRPGGGGRGRRDDRPATNPNLRAAQTRRDGLGGSGGGGGGRGGGGGGRGGGGRPGGGRPGGGRPGGGRRDDREERVNPADLRKLNQEAAKSSSNPFAAFFKDGDEKAD